MKVSHLGIALCCSAVVMAVAWGSLRPGQGEPSSTRPRVVFVSDLRTPDDPRGRALFIQFQDAVRRIDPETASSVTFEFAAASTTGGVEPRDVIAGIARRRPAAIVAASDSVLEAAAA